MPTEEIIEDPDTTTHVLGIGDEVTTPKGTGVVVAISLALGNYDGDLQLEPPSIEVELNDGTVIHTCLCELDLGEHTEVIQKEFDRLWPPMTDDIPEDAEMLIPEYEDKQLRSGAAAFEIETILDDLEAVQRELFALDDLWEAGRLDEHYYYEKASELSTELTDLEQQLAAARLRERRVTPLRLHSETKESPMLTLAAVSEADRRRFFSDKWGKNLLAALELDGSVDDANSFFEHVWSATFNELDKLLEVLTKKDTGALAKKVGFDLLQNMAGISYFTANEVIYDAFDLQFTGGEQVYTRWKNLFKGLEKYLPRKAKKDLNATIDVMESKLKAAAKKVVDAEGSTFLDKLERPEGEEKAAAIYEPSKGATTVTVEEVMKQYRDADEAGVTELVRWFNEGIVPGAAAAEEFLKHANAVLDSFGVEGLNLGTDAEKWELNWDEGIIADYVNCGDTYCGTFLYDIENDTMYWTTWGDFLEAWEHERREDLGYDPLADEHEASVENESEMGHEAGFDTDESVARELSLYLDNDQELYRQKLDTFYKNLATKVAQGKYDHELAVKLFMYLVERGARSYAKEFGGEEAGWHEMFPKNIRHMVAEELRDEFEEAVRNDEYDFQTMIPKKYRGQPLQLPLADEHEAAVKKTAGWDQPVRVYIADLAAYNAGKLIGEWITLPAGQLPPLKSGGL